VPHRGVFEEKKNLFDEYFHQKDSLFFTSGIGVIGVLRAL
jgi:hypothetical protein